MVDPTILTIAFGILALCVNAAGIIWHKTKPFEEEYAAKNQKVLNELNKQFIAKIDAIVDLQHDTSVNSEFGKYEEKIGELSEFATQVDNWYKHIIRGKELLKTTAGNLVKFGICIVFLTLIVPIMIESDLSDDAALFLFFLFLGLLFYAFSRITSIPANMKEYHRITKLIDNQFLRLSKGLLPELEPIEDLDKE